MSEKARELHRNAAPVVGVGLKVLQVLTENSYASILVAVQREGFEILQQDRYRQRLESIVKTTEKFLRSPLTLLGNTLTIVGCLGLLLALSGVIDARLFAVGLSSGIRVIGTVAITGCLLSAIGYGLAEYYGK